ncbi:hypothetical protein ACFUN7_27635 [Streptomyces sp. NPDC057236]|uniref:hypothetical protein n=1 Tax=Streptomyces sp. NPDC057236 TaxID=3346059 RepID=UPI003642D22C
MGTRRLPLLLDITGFTQDEAGTGVALPTGPGHFGAGPPTALATVLKLVESAQARWRTVNALRLIAPVRAGAHFERSRLMERPATAAAQAPAHHDRPPRLRHQYPHRRRAGPARR